MRTLLLIALAACGAFAVPLPDDSSAVDLVPPRRVYTGHRGRPSLRTDALAGFRSDILRQLFGSSGLPRLAPPTNPNCDEGTFRLSDAAYRAVQDCRRSSAEPDLRQCILDALPEETSNNELREFLDRDEYSINGVFFGLSIVLQSGEMTQRRSVTLQLCPPADERNLVESGEEEGEGTEEPEEPTYRPRRPSFPALGNDWPFGSRPTFQTRRNPFFNFDAFKPIFDFKPSFPSFPDFDFDIPDFPAAGYDPETCVKQTFDLPREQFVKARSCLGASQSFQECLTEKLNGFEESKDLLQFVGAENTVVVDRRFFSSVSSVNGVETRKTKIQLTHCEEVEAEEEEGQDEEQQQGETLPQEPTTVQETPLDGEDFEP